MAHHKLLEAGAFVVLAGFAGAWVAGSVPRWLNPRQTRGDNRLPTARRDWPSFGLEPSRSNALNTPTGIDARNVASLKRQQVQMDGTVDASAIYLKSVGVKAGIHDVFFVTTTYGKTIAIDANDGSTLWEFTPPDYASWAGSYRITTATPVADPNRQFIYAASPDGHIQKLSVRDGQPQWRTPITLLPAREKIAAALNFFRDRVIAVTGGYIGDQPPYQGHVAVVDSASGRVLHVWNSLCSDRAGLIEPHSCPESGSAIWGRAGAVLDPETGDIFVATGNGLWDGRTNWGDATLELDSDATRILANYTPSNTEQLDASDADLGSTAPVFLGGGLLVQGGKDGRIRLLSVSAMGGAVPHRGGEVQSVAAETDLFTAPAVLRTTGSTWVFTADRGGTAAWSVTPGGLVAKWQNRNSGTSPAFAGGLLYVYDPNGGLRVYQPETGQWVQDLECGPGHWNSPIVVDGRIALPEGNANAHATSGVLDIWRLPNAATTASPHPPADAPR